MSHLREEGQIEHVTSALAKAIAAAQEGASACPT